MDEWLFFSSLSSELIELHSFKRVSLLHVTTEHEGCLWFSSAETVWVASSHVAEGALRAVFTLCQAGLRRDPNECLILEPFLGFQTFQILSNNISVLLIWLSFCKKFVLLLMLHLPPRVPAAPCRFHANVSDVRSPLCSPQVWYQPLVKLRLLCRSLLFATRPPRSPFRWSSHSSTLNRTSAPSLGAPPLTWRLGIYTSECFPG